MCYNIQLLAARIKKSGKRKNKTDEEIAQAMEMTKKQWEGKPMFSLYGFDFPELPIIAYTNRIEALEAHWGLIPHWCQDITQQDMLRNQTLNARIESIDEKPSFRGALEQRRCLIPVTGYYEFKHFGKRAIPHFLYPSDRETMWMAGLFDETSRGPSTIRTCTIVTTKANKMAASIHNQAKSDGPRMPLLLDFETAETWLQGSPAEALAMGRNIHTPDDYLSAHMVKPLRGQQSPGNVEEASSPFVYKDLLIQGDLFEE